MFCRECGAQCIFEDEELGYNSGTGRREIYRKFTCPTGKCGHEGHRCDFQPNPVLSFWQRALNSRQYYKCTKCGSEADEYDFIGGW